MYSLTIVGGGAISCGYDSPNDTNILTHIHGALSHQNIKLNTIVEISKQQQQIIRNKWGNNFHISDKLKETLISDKSDIVIIATPTNLHLSIIEDIFNIYEPKLIICEKPTVSNIIEFNILQNIFNTRQTKLMTNFTRRFDPSLNKLKKIIQTEANKIYHFYGTFSKGYIHNGSHMIDLIFMLIGDIINIDTIDKRIINNDIFGQFIINTTKANGIISNINNNTLSLFEFSIYTDIAKIEITGSEQQIIITYIEESKIFEGFQSFSKEDILLNTLKKSGYNTLDYAINILNANNNSLYEELYKEQYNINTFIFKSKEELLEG